MKHLFQGTNQIKILALKENYGYYDNLEEEKG